MSEASYNNHEEYSYIDDLDKLISELEEIACTNKEDYSLGLSDLYEKHEPDVDLGGEITSNVYFRAQKTRASHISPNFGQIYGDVIMTSYQIGGVIGNAKPNFNSFPVQIQEYLMESIEVDLDENRKNPWHETLCDETTQFLVEYRYSHTINSDGTVIPESELVILVDEEEFAIPETAAADYSQKPTKKVEQRPSELDMSGFEASLDPELLITLEALQGQLAHRHEQARVLSAFYEQIELVRFMSSADRLKSVRSTIKYLFEDEAA